MNKRQIPANLYALVVIALVACSMLMYEILLTRISALRLFFHFSFLVVSNCLLGIGASGTLLALLQETFGRRPRFWVSAFTLLYIASLAGTYVLLLEFSIDPEMSRLWSPKTARFFFYTLMGALPFFFGGAVVGLILTSHAPIVNTVYCWDLVGAGLGCLALPLALARWGAGGAISVVVILALVAWLVALPRRHDRWSLPIGGALILAGMAVAPRLDNAYPVPGKGNLDLTRDFSASLAREIHEYSKWSVLSRIDMMKLPKGERFMFCLGKKTKQRPLPEVRMIAQDGTAGTLVLNWSEHPELHEVLKESMYSASMQLKHQPEVFIIGVGGGNDVWAAKVNGGRYVKGIELNDQILEIHRRVLPDFSREIVVDSNIELVYGEGRSELMRDGRQYDIVQMTGIDTWTALASGAYVLAENYLYTIEALDAMWRHLKPGGILQVTRMAAEMETLRLLANLYEVYRRDGLDDFRNAVILLRTDEPLIATLLKKEASFTDGEVARVEAFAEHGGIDVIYLPRRPHARSNEIARFVERDDKASYIRDYPRNITVTTDNQPYFFNFTKWANPWAAKRFIHEPTHVSQGNPLFLVIQLGVSSTLAFGLILLPIVIFRKRGMDSRYLPSFVLYFASLGVGFIWIEIALMQKLTLFLGHPILSTTVTLFALLVFSGMGSLISREWLQGSASRALVVPGGLMILLIAVIFVSPALVRHHIGLPLAARIALTVMLLAPISLLLGVPFAYGIRLLDRHNPTLIPLAWAVNGSMTVIGAVLAVILSMNVGFNLVLMGAVLVYFAGFWSIRRLAL